MDKVVEFCKKIIESEGNVYCTRDEVICDIDCINCPLYNIDCLNPRNYDINVEMAKKYIAEHGGEVVKFKVVNVNGDEITFINDNGDLDITFKGKFRKAEENKMEKTLLSIILEGFNNKVYEDYEGNMVYIASNSELIFNYKEPKILDNTMAEIINLQKKYTLRRNKYNFTEAFEAYEEGKEIESCEGQKYKFIKIDDDNRVLYEGEWVENVTGFNFEEIRGKWYING